MEQILIDTSVWINFFKNIKTPACDFLENNIGNMIITTCPTITQEVLQGIVSDKEEKKIKAYFDSFDRLVEEPYQIAMEAAELYRYLRKHGVTIRKPNDCLIAMYAIKNNIRLLNDDRDFTFIADHTALKLVE
ncbi:type II toxin-antitoxin system VapC family toxin [Mucilaginibacter mali]|nr:PIN domain-containing protein [Mucilaginibacter mali]